MPKTAPFAVAWVRVSCGDPDHRRRTFSSYTERIGENDEIPKRAEAQRSADGNPENAKTLQRLRREKHVLESRLVASISRVSHILVESEQFRL